MPVHRTIRRTIMLEYRYDTQLLIDGEDLDEDEVHIQVLCDVAADFAPDYDIDKVFKAVLAQKRHSL